MIWRAATMFSAAAFVTTLFGQTAPELPTVLPEPRTFRPEAQRALREYMKKYSQEKPGVCSIPLLEVPVSKNVAKMPNVLPPAPHDEAVRMPSVKVPAPPCKEEKR